MREHTATGRADHERAMSLAWHVAALQRAKRLPRLRALLGRRRKGRPAVVSPEMTPDREARIRRLAAGLTVAIDEAYAQGEVSDE